MTPRTTCPDCNGAMGPIRLLDHRGGLAEGEPRYAAGEAEPSRFLHRLPRAGTVRRLCAPTAA